MLGEEFSSCLLKFFGMSVIKNSYSSSQNIPTYFVRIRKNTEASESVIIEDDVLLSTTVSNRDPLWLRIQTDCQITVLSSAPSGVTAFSPSHADFEKTLIFVKSAETFVVRHSATPMTTDNRTEVTGYQAGSSDTIYLKIEHSENTTTVYS